MIIYVNNFRGFTSTFLPLRKINFFVGENSTGKTSILKLIKTISNHRFWLTFDFNSDDAELGHFAEIVNKDSDKQFFEIGILGDKSEYLKGLLAVKLKFTSNDGLADLTELRMIDNGIDYHILKKKKEVWVRYQELNIDTIETDKQEKYFKFWIENETIKSKNFQRVNIEEIGINVSNIMLNIPNHIEKKGTLSNEKKRLPRGFRIPTFFRDITWLAPIRAEPKRTYDSYKISFSPEGTHIPYLLRDLISNSNPKASESKRILEEFGKESGLFEKLEVNLLGKDKTSPFEVHIYLEGKPFKISNVGYGISQILPLIVEILARRKGNWFAIQQPEIHLHPKGQAAYGQFIFNSYLADNNNFIVETHSDFTIDRFRLALHREYKKENAERHDAQVVFFDRTSNGNSLTIIPILPNGTYPDEQPKNFKDFFIKEQLNLIQL